MTRHAAALLATLFAAFHLQAAAQERPWYFRIDAGVSQPYHTDVHSDPGSTVQFVTGPLPLNGQPADNLQFKSESQLFGAGVGWRFTQAWRAELAVAYRGGYNMHELTQSASNPTRETVTGRLRSLSGMVNLYRDFDLEGWPFKPYVGAGFGASRNSNDQYNTFRGGAPITERQILANAVVRPAWNIALGGSFDLAGLTWDLGYRYADLGTVQSGQVTFLQNNPPTRQFDPRLVGHLRTNEITLGLRF